MSPDPSLVKRPESLESGELGELVRRLVTEVLLVPAEQVRPESALIEDLGAESIDFLDLIFRLEEALGRKIPIDRWDAFVRERLAGLSPARALTVEVVREFAVGEARRA